MIVEKKQKISNLSSWKTGGEVEYSITLTKPDDFRKAIAFCQTKSVPYFVVGKTTNVLFTDEKINAAMIRLGGSFDFIEVNDEFVKVGASTYAPTLARRLQTEGLSGLEHIVGIPATLGGLVTMNGGSLRKTLSSNILRVHSVNKKGEVIIRENHECDFQYRKSIFNSLNELIISVEFKLIKGESNLIRKTCLNILKERRSKFPRKLPNCGSVFKSCPNLYKKIGPPGKIIESLGLKGRKIGGAEISNLHANFIVNSNKGSSEDILSLIYLIKDEVFLKYNHNLETEVIFIDSNGKQRDINIMHKRIRC